MRTDLESRSYMRTVSCRWSLQLPCPATSHCDEEKSRNASQGCLPVQSLTPRCRGCHAMHLTTQDEENSTSQAQVRRTEVMCLAELGAKIQSRKFPLISGKHRNE